MSIIVVSTVSGAPMGLTITTGNSQSRWHGRLPQSNGFELSSAITSMGTTDGGKSSIRSSRLDLLLGEWANHGTTYFFIVEGVNSVVSSWAFNEASAVLASPPSLSLSGYWEVAWSAAV